MDTKNSYALGTWERVERTIDRYLAEWAQMRSDVCEARILRGTQSEELFDLRMSCLQKRMQELGSLVNVFVEADTGVVQKAVQAGSSLAPIAICVDEEALRAPYPPPKTKDKKAKVAAIREKLADVEALYKTGKYKEGMALAHKLDIEAERVGYRPVQAEVLYQLGRLLEKIGEYEEAETTLNEALNAAGESRDAMLAAKVMVLLVWVTGYHQERHEVGLSLGRDASAMLNVSGGDEPIRARLLDNMGILFWREGSFDKALEYHLKSVTILKKALGPEHPFVSSPLNNLGGVFSSQGNYEKALEYYRYSLAIKEKTLGPEHPEVALPLHNVGSAFLQQGKLGKALECYRRALANWEKTLGSEHPLIAHPLSEIGSILVEQCQAKRALEFLERAMRICQNETCDPEPHGRILFALVRALVATGGDKQRAIKLAKQAQELFGKTPKAFKKELEEVSDWLEKHGKR